ncbi:MAG: hypothetical protein QXO69_00660 [archaeon]
MQKAVQLFSLVFALIGVFLAYAFAPDQQYEPFEKCEGQVKAHGTIVKAFFSSKGNYVGVLKTRGITAMVIIDYSFSKGDNVTVYARASNYSGQCWLFPDSVVRDD